MSSKGKALKAGIWYTISNFLNRACSMILTPIMTRLLTTEEYGEFANFSSWSSILMVITTLDMTQIVIRAKYDYEDTYDDYMSSIMTVNIGFTALCHFIIVLFQSQFTQLFDMDIQYINMLFVYLYFTPALTYYSSQQRALMKYKLASIATLVKNIMAMALSILFCFMFEDRLWGRTIGFIVPSIVIGGVIYLHFIRRSRTVSWEAIKYTLKMSIPLIPHTLSVRVLNQSDRIVIKKYHSSKDVAIYSLGYSLSQIIYMFFSAILSAYVPYMYEEIEKGNKESIRKSWRLLGATMLLIVAGIIAIAPEVILIFGGRAYSEVVVVLPAILVGVYLDFLSAIYVKFEHYMRKSLMTSVGSLIAAGVNLSLNLILVPRFGYHMAAYTTLIAYMMVFLIHFTIVSRTQYCNWVDNKSSFVMIGISFLIIPLGEILYNMNVIRYIVIILYIIIVLALAYRYMKDLKKMLEK